ncbi:MAG: HD family hydrolase [Anaerolineae bacterium]
MNADRALALLLRATQLKRVPRVGWVMRGLVDAESVSDHSFGVAFVALVLAELTEQPVDVAKLLTIALIHDLPEAVLGDIPSPASAYFPRNAKPAAEAEALMALLRELPQLEQWQRWWREYAERSSVEGRLVRDADHLDRLIQAYVYEQTTGNLWLDEFWRDTTAGDFGFEASSSLFLALCEARERSREAP